MTPEGKLKKNVKALLDALGAYYFMPVQTGYGATTLDFLCCIKGRFVAIELKAAGKKPTPLQVLKMEEIEKAGGLAFWADDLLGVIDALKEHGFELERPINLYMA